MGKATACVLGGSGTLGREYIKALSNHPMIELVSVTGDSSVGKTLGEISESRGFDSLPSKVSDIKIVPSKPELIESDLVFSCLPTEVAGTVESAFREYGHKVITDASPHRLDPDVPLIIPEVNPDQFGMIEAQRAAGSKGWIVATPNCSAVGVALALAPLRNMGVVRVGVTTMQSLSGAGYPGVPSLDILDNLIPFISGEEEKIAKETNKILGRHDNPILFAVTSTRVPVLYGHTASLNIEFDREVSPVEVSAALSSFRGRPQELSLPSAPEKPILVSNASDAPQPRLTRDAGTVPGMAVTVGRIRKGFDNRSVQFVTVTNNVVRGGAGGAVLTSELMLKERLI
ncbi:MAG: aspartate-semialdehyde dehydrogenase [Thermoprotei archaeon]